MPDLAHSVADRWQIKTGWFTLKFGEDIVVDYTAFTQDAAGISQAGRQRDQWQPRWVLAGENRPYDHSVGHTGRVIPQYHRESLEFVARLSRVDLIDGPVQGGKFYKTYPGVNWWMSHQCKVGFGWGLRWLDRFGKTGIMDSFFTRLQWVF